MALVFATACSSHLETEAVAIARPINVSIDDCGWQSGPSLADAGGPWRLGARDPTLQDYARLARIAQASGTRLLTLWVMSELDRGNICGRPEYNMPDAPSDMTEQGLAWDNSVHVNDDNFALMSFMYDNAAWLELGLHGVRHEHWEHGERTRAEFGQKNGPGWGAADTATHLTCFAELLHQYYTRDENPFPVSFVPPDHGYPSAAAGPSSTGAALASFGVRYGQLPGPTRFDNGVFLMDRDTSVSPPWDAEGRLPGTVLPSQSWIMTHLPNYYDLESEWIDWLSGLNAPLDRMTPKNSALAASQLLYTTYARLGARPDGLYINTRDLPNEAYAANLLGPLALKVRLDGQSSVALSSNSDLRLVASYLDRHDHAVILLGQLNQPRGRLAQDIFHIQLLVGRSPATDWVDLASSTANVFSVTRNSANEVVAEVEVYGQQTIDLVLPGFEVGSVRSDSAAVSVLGWTWDAAATRVSVSVSGANMQGEITHLIVSSTPSDTGHNAAP